MKNRILVVDDDELIRIALETMLTAKGYSIDCANGGQEALDKLETEDYGVVFLDIVMPKMDGIEVCRRIRDTEKGRTLTIVMLSAKSQEEDQLAGKEAGADLFLSKPIAPEALLQTVQQILPLKG